MMEGHWNLKETWNKTHKIQEQYLHEKHESNVQAEKGWADHTLKKMILTPCKCYMFLSG